MNPGNKLTGIPRACKKRVMMVAVFEDTEKYPKPEKHHPPMGSFHGTSIKVCRGRIKSACNPGVCDCPDEACKHKKTKTEILIALLRFAIFGFAVEEAVRYGIWSDASKTDELTNRYLSWAEGFFPTMNKTERTPQEQYDRARIRYNLKNVWNNTISGLNSFVASIPGMIAKAPGYFFPKQPEVDLIEKTSMKKVLGQKKNKTKQWCAQLSEKWKWYAATYSLGIPAVVVKEMKNFEMKKNIGMFKKHYSKYSNKEILRLYNSDEYLRGEFDTPTIGCVHNIIPGRNSSRVICNYVENR